jgi:CHAT domain-containing protein
MVQRGVSKSDITEILKNYKSSSISSDENFADLLGKLYPADRGIGILFYFFNADSLRRVFFEPGKIIEKKTTFITKDQLLQLSIDLNYVLGLKQMAASRTPVNRGIKVKEKPATAGITYASIINKATKLLLPTALGKQYQHLLIIPALNIGTIPFQLLKPYKNDSLLIDKCSVTIVPGLLDLLALRTKALKRVTGWGGDVSDKYDLTFRVGFSYDGYTSFELENPLFISNPAYPTNTDFYFPDLPGAKNEIDSSKKYAAAYTLLEGSDAIKDSVIEHMKNADVVYFATHGIADEEKPMEKSFLVLSGDDPFLTAKNIMDLRNDTSFGGKFPEMVILSACQTGLGKSMEAGIAGLARSFLLAGSNHVIMSLWNVNDNATAYLMNRFIFHLQEKNLFMPSEPLRLAMLDTRKKFPEPSQWASFSMFGIDY